MKILTLKAVIICAHIPPGKVSLSATQKLVTVEGVPVLVRADPEAKSIVGCPNARPGIKPCTLTLVVKKGYSDLMRIDGRQVCLDTINGLTDGTPPGTVNYTVQKPGQTLVSEAA
ncbi:MAG TPA: hypothetical protein VF806_07015 [Anaerolineaceae bacterium]